MSLKRLLKKVKKREALKLNNHLEKLGAAFVKETGLKPSETALLQKENEDGTKEYSFTTRTWNPADLSAETGEMFTIAAQWAQAKSHEELLEGQRLMREFLERFK